MANFDTADLLARVKRYARVPTTTEWPADPDWYAWLTEAEQDWKVTLAQHDPAPMLSDPVLLTSNDSGITYQFPSSEQPIYFEVYASINGEPLVPGAYHDHMADYVDQGTEIRMTRSRARTFSDGPYLRYVAAPAAISAGVNSTISPAKHRIVLVFDALERYASSGGGVQDPNYWRGLLQKELRGDPDVGTFGILGEMARRDNMRGLAARGSPRMRRWWAPS